MKLPFAFGINRLRSTAWFWAFIVFHLFDWCIYFTRLPVTAWNGGVYGINLILSFLLFVSVGYVIHALPNRSRKVASIFIAFAQTWVIASHYFIFKAMGETVNVSMLKFVIDNPTYYGGFINTYLFNENIVFVIALWCLCAFIWYPKENVKTNEAKRRTLYISVSILSILLHFIILNQARIILKGKKISADVALVFALKNYSKYFFESDVHGQKLHPSDHKKCLEGIQCNHSDDENKNDEPNILIVINESWGKNYVWLYDKADNCMPFFRSWVENEPENFLVYQSAFSNSNATDVSMPSLLTGVPPWESNEKLHTAPFVWNWASSIGMKTFFVSSQHFSWADLDDFFFSSPPEITVNADRISLPQVNDLGVDDIAMTEHVAHALDSIPSKKRFLGVYHTNALHGPFQQQSDYLENQPRFPVKYENALYILDASYEKIYTMLKKKNMLENTIIVFTSDHGETECVTHKPGRVNSFYDDIMSIPFMIYVPPLWRKKNPDKYNILRANEKKQVCNIDIVPTILDFLHFPNNAKSKISLSGKSLLTPIEENRYVFACNTNDVRHWGDEGFGIYGSKYHLVYSTQEPVGLYDIKTDAREKFNKWGTIPEPEKKVFYRIIDSISHFKRIAHSKRM